MTHLRAAYRRTGADAPWHDPRGAHGVPMEGWYWRLVTDDGGVVVALCGVVTGPDGTEALAALATGDGGVVTARGRGAAADRRTLGLEVPGLVRASPSLLELAVAPGEALHLRMAGGAWPRRATGGLGPAGWLPGLSQYWHPHTLAAPARGTLTRAGRPRAVRGLLYAEKNWGPGFPSRWWWAQAHDADTLVAVAGGRLQAGPAALHATALVLRHGGRLLRVVAPAGLVRTRVGDGTWRFRGWTARDRVEVEGRPGARAAARLPVPAAAGLPGGTVDQHLAGSLHVRWRRDGRLVVDREIGPAGLEDGRRGAP